MPKLRTAVVGAGRMGQLHSRIYSQMAQVELIAIVDSDKSKAQAVAAKYGGQPYDNPEQIVDLIDAVTVAVPTQFHTQVAEPFLARGIGVLVEKPIASSLADAQRMHKLAQGNNATLQVGYSERFNPVVQAMHRLEFTPRFIEAQRISPYTFRSTDVGVVLDMMIHDIDIILSLANSPVADLHAIGVNVLGKHEDVANVRLTFASGCVANLTASRLALKTDRKIRVFSEQAYLSLDYLKKTGIMISKMANMDMMQWIRENQNSDGEMDMANADWSEMVNIENLDIDEREPLHLEQEAFIKAVSEGTRPQVSAEDAIAAMELAERIVKTISEHHWEGVSSAAISAEHWQKTLDE
jgi:predicted dehydrogenase